MFKDAFYQTTKEDPKINKNYREEVESMSEIELQRELLYTVAQLKDLTQHTEAELERIRKNVVFFFWLIMLPAVIWGIIYFLYLVY